MEQAKILLAGNDPDLLQRVGSLLAQKAHIPEIAHNDNDALVRVGRIAPDLVIYNLDEENSQEGGFETCMKIRKRTMCPIITLSVHHDDENWIKALTLCADNYLVKPFTDEWLLAVVNASLRLWLTYKKGRKIPDTAIQRGDLSIDPDRHKVTLHGEIVQLTPREFDILYYLAKNQGRSISHEELTLAVWGESHREPRQLRSFISQIRKKIEEVSSDPEYILTIPGFGYRLSTREPMGINGKES